MRPGKIKKAIVIFLVSIIGVIFLIVILLNFSFSHRFITGKVNEILYNSHIPVKIHSINTILPNSIRLDGLFLHGPGGDTIVYTGRVNVRFSPLALIRRKVSVRSLSVENSRVILARSNKDEQLNIAAAFSGGKKDTLQTLTGNPHPWEISVGKAGVTNLRLDMTDSVGGIYINQHVRKILIRTKMMSLIEKTVLVRSLEINGATGSIVTDPPAGEQDTTHGPGWNIGLTELLLGDVKINFDEPGKKLKADLMVGELDIKANKTDLLSKVLEFDRISISGTNAVLYTDVEDQVPREEKSTPSQNFPWEIRAGDIKLQDIAFSMQKYSESGKDNPMTGFSITGLNMQVSDLEFGNADMNANIEKLDFVSGNGFSIKKMKADLSSHSGKNRIDLSMETADSRLNLTVSAEGKPFEIINDPARIRKAKISVSKTSISVNDLIYLKRDSDILSIIRKIDVSPVSLEGDVMLDNSALLLPSFSISPANNLKISLNGKAGNIFFRGKAAGELHFGITDIDTAWLKKLFTVLKVGATAPDFKSLSLEGALYDSLRAPGFDIKLKSDLGNAGFNGSYNTVNDSFLIKGLLTGLSLGRITRNSTLGSFSGKVEAKGGGIKKKPLRADMDLQIDTLNVKGYNYTNALVHLRVRDKKYEAGLFINDPSLECRLDAGMIFSDSGLEITTTGNFLGRLNELHIYKDTLSAGGTFKGDFIKRAGVIRSEIEISDLKVSTPRNEAGVGPINISLRADSLKTAMTAGSDFFTAGISIDKPYNELGTVFTGFRRYLQSFLEPAARNKAYRTSLLPEMNASLSLHNNRILGLLSSDTTINFRDLSVSFFNRRADNTIYFDIKGNSVRYKMAEISRLNANLSDSTGVLKLKIESDSCLVYSHPLKKIIISGRFADLNGLTRVMVTDQGNRMAYDLDVSESIDSSKIVFEIPSRQIVLNGFTWQMNSPDLLSYNRKTKSLNASFAIHTDSSRLAIATEDTAGAHKYWIEMKNVTLESLVRSDLVQGNPGGSISGFAEYSKMADQGSRVSADFHLRDASWSGLDFKSIDLSGYFSSGNRGIYDFDATAHLDSAEIVLRGKKPLNGNREIDAQFKSIPIKTIQPFVNKYLTDLKGLVSGNFNLSTGEGPENLTGDLLIDGVRLRIIQLNSLYRMPQEKILFRGQKIILSNFKVLDSLNHELLVDGDVDFSNRKQVMADLSVIASNLQVMNKKEDNSSSFYGKIFIDSKLSVRGPVTSPLLKGKIILKRGTDIFFRQQENLSVPESGTVVTFMSSRSLKGQKSTGSESESEIYNKTSIESEVEIDPSTIINIKISQRMFNIDLIIKGGGELNYNMLANSRVNLAGKYEVSEGSADLKMIGWPNKKFIISKGGVIRWDGKLDDPELQFEASNKVHSSYTNPVDNKQHEVDFNVLLKLSGRLSSLNVLFTINTPDQYLMSIINTLSPEEQMRQAITILLFEKIDLPGISTSSSYVTEQVNQLVSSQLNQLTKTTIKGIDISFGLDTYTESSTTGSQQTKTSLSYDVRKALLNNRAKIEISGRLNDYSNPQGNSNLSLNNFSFEYQIDSSGNKFIKVYNERSYEDVFEGEVVKTGVGFTYRKKYHTLSDIWKRKKKINKTKNKDN
jgi:translocation and assembly module TamB